MLCPPGALCVPRLRCSPSRVDASIHGNYIPVHPNVEKLWDNEGDDGVTRVLGGTGCGQC